MHANIFIVARHKLNGAFIIVTGFKTQKGLSEAVHAPAGPGSVRPQETTLKRQLCGKAGSKHAGVTVTTAD